ncbi:MAG: hypothetical protein F6K10_11590 [Moorea sp. SIO2B7]|nr:hypothetical protein [Moorena sp. SIO2B7]
MGNWQLRLLLYHYRLPVAYFRDPLPKTTLDYEHYIINTKYDKRQKRT